MSFMGAIGYIMAGSRLKELWSTIYAANSIEKMMTGHAYSRAVRAHFLTQLCLGKIILDELDLPESKKNTLKNYIFSKNSTNLTLDDIEDLEILQDVMSIIQCHIKNIESRRKIAILWVQYFFFIFNLLRRFICAERSGNWYAHLKCVEKMILFFHSSGHFQYAKAAHLYFQDMYGLKTNMKPGEFKQFCDEGYFIIKRLSKFWCGTWSDMTIEQTMMRSMKTSGGLTSSRGFNSSILIR